MKYVTKGTIAAGLSVLAIIAGAAHQAGLASFAGASGTADLVYGVIAGIFAVIAGISDGLKTPPPAA